MLRARSWEGAQQHAWKDARYWTSHSTPDMRFVEVPWKLLRLVRLFIKNNILHEDVDIYNGRHTAIIPAQAAGLPPEQVKEATVTKAAGDQARHCPRPQFA